MASERSRMAPRGGIEPSGFAQRATPGRAFARKVLWLRQVRTWWCPGAGSNHRHCDFQSHALPTELPGHAAGPKTQASGRFIVRSGGCVHPPSAAASARRHRLRISSPTYWRIRIIRGLPCRRRGPARCSGRRTSGSNRRRGSARSRTGETSARPACHRSGRLLTASPSARVAGKDRPSLLAHRPFNPPQWRSTNRTGSENLRRPAA